MALNKSIACLTRFALPTWLFFVLFAFLLRMYDVRYYEAVQVTDDVFQLQVFTNFLGVWVVAKSALLSQRERIRLRPSLVGAVRALVVGVLVGGGIARFLYSIVQVSETASIFFALAMIGVAAHFITPERDLESAGSEVARDYITKERYGLGDIIRVVSRGLAKIPENCSASWLNVTVIASALLLVLARLGIIAPSWFFIASNPIALLGNWLSLTGSLFENILILEHFVGYAPYTFGVPIIGTFVVWFFLSISPSRYKGVHFLFVIFPACLAFQITVQRALVVLSDEFQYQGQYERAGALLEINKSINEKMRNP